MRIPPPACGPRHLDHRRRSVKPVRAYRCAEYARTPSIGPGVHDITYAGRTFGIYRTDRQALALISDCS